jgi:hypothetical protein
MNHLRASLYQHILASRWSLIDQGFVNVSHSSDGSQHVSVHGSAQFPAIFSFAAGEVIARSDSWFQWCHTVDGISVTSGLRFSCSSDGNAFCDLLPRISILNRASAREEWKEAGRGEIGRSFMHSRSDEALRSATVPLYIHQISALSHDLQFDP